MNLKGRDRRRGKTFIRSNSSGDQNVRQDQNKYQTEVKTGANSVNEGKSKNINYSH